MGIKHSKTRVGSSTIYLDAGTISYVNVQEGSAGISEVQTFYFSDTPTSGTYTITINGQTTSAINYDASTTDIKNAIAALSNITSVTSVSGAGSVGDPYTVTFPSSEGNVPEMTVDTTNLVAGSGSADFASDDFTNGEPGVTSHVWTLTFAEGTTGTATLQLHESSPAEVDATVDSTGFNNALSAVWPGNYFDGGVPPAVSVDGGVVTWTITIDSSNVPVDPTRSATEDFGSGSQPTATVGTTANGSTGTQEIQRYTLSDSPTYGTYKIFTNGTAMSHDSSASAVESEIESELGVGVSVAQNGFQYTITWDNAGTVSNTILQPTNINLYKEP